MLATKKQYVTATLRIVDMQAEDVVTASVADGVGYQWREDWTSFIGGGVS